MANLVVVGMQWGDEGKGKIVDLLCPAFDVVARYQGGHNAGHTVKFGDSHFSLHLIPSGILHPGALCVLGNGMVIDPEAFLAELGRLEGMGVRSQGRLFVSDRAHLILPALAQLDRAREAASGARKIGTTGRGIGLAYEAKAGRVGLRVADLYDSRIEERLRAQIERLRPELEARGGSEKREQPSLPSIGDLAALCRGWAEQFAPFVRDTAALLDGWRREGKSVLCEGAQGALLDLDHGTYPFVTSSNSIAGGACTGLGIPPTFIDGTLGVLKAYTTRVGGGPFPTELDDATGEFLRQRGNEFGTTTGRPRRCGWMDLVAARTARRLSGIDVIALTKLDVLDTQTEIQICTGYRHGGKVLTEFPARLDVVEDCEPVYRTVKGWNSPTVSILEFEDLPVAARDYVRLLEDEIGARVSLVSTGPRREETIVNEDPLLAELTSGRLAQVLLERGA